MGRRRTHPRSKGRRVSLAELGVLQGRDRTDNAIPEDTQWGADTVQKLKRDPPDFGDQLIEETDPERRRRLADIVVSKLRRAAKPNKDDLARFVAEALEQERQCHLADELWDFQRNLVKSYDLVTVSDIYADLSRAGIVTTDRYGYCGSHNFIAYPNSAAAAVQSLWIDVLKAHLPKSYNSQLDVLLGLSESLSGKPLDGVNKDLLKAHPFHDGDLVSYFTDKNGAGINAEKGFVITYGPIRISSRASTSKITAVYVELPRSIAIDVLKQFVRLTEPYAQRHNAERPPTFKLALSQAQFFMAARTVPHFLGKKGTQGKNSHITELIARLNLYTEDGQPQIQRGDFYICVLPGNAQCTAALYCRTALNEGQKEIVQSDIDHKSGNIDCWAD